jgi:predicted TIM-barrel fold metal-dependent hydrolase
MERHPNISIILSHAGGAVPYLTWRLCAGERNIPNLSEVAPAGILNYLKRFYYDTAMSSNPYTFGSLTELVDPSKILFGTDYISGPDFRIEEYLREIENYSGFNTLSISAIERGNALGLFPRFNL